MSKITPDITGAFDAERRRYIEHKDQRMERGGALHAQVRSSFSSEACFIPGCGITTLASFRKAVDGLPDDYILSTNRLGNLTILKPTQHTHLLEMVGYIELLDIRDYDGSVIRDCEFTRVDDEGHAG